MTRDRDRGLTRAMLHDAGRALDRVGHRGLDGVFRRLRRARRQGGGHVRGETFTLGVEGDGGVREG